MELSEMLQMQKALHEKHKDDWDPMVPETAPKQLLWGIGEMGEVIDVVKKFGAKGIENDPVIRKHLLEEMGDVIMYMLDMLLCYDIKIEEFEEVYREKCKHNLGRDYGKEQQAWRDAEEEKQKNKEI